jgi:hypothetical protein
MKVFLGGTCNESNWRNLLIPMLKIDYFNPVVDDWTPECQKREIEERETADFVIYTITKEMTGVYAIAEVVDDSNKRPEKTIFCVLKEGFNEKQLRSLKAVAQMVQRNGGKFFDNLKEMAMYLNEKQHLDSGIRSR